MKQCKECQEIKEIKDFYRHPQSKDGTTNKCKECTRNRVKENRKEKIEYYREFDKKRGNRLKEGYIKYYRQKYPNKYKAQTLVGNAIRDKKLYKKPCETCGSTQSIHAHHDDYLEPLNVRWLCAAHHRQWHVLNGEAKNP